MARIQFKAKPEAVHYAGEESPRYYRVKIPVLDRKHCDMGAFRNHPKYGGYANSDLFKGMLSRIRKDVFGGADYVRLDAIPADVTVDTSGFLTIVSFDV